MSVFRKGGVQPASAPRREGNLTPETAPTSAPAHSEGFFRNSRPASSFSAASLGGAGAQQPLSVGAAARGTGDRPSRQRKSSLLAASSSAQELGFSSNATPRLRDSEFASVLAEQSVQGKTVTPQVGETYFERRVILPEEEEPIAALRRSVDERKHPSTSAIPPALPDELLEALAKSPTQAHSFDGASQGSSKRLPEITPASPFVRQTEKADTNSWSPRNTSAMPRSQSGDIRTPTLLNSTTPRAPFPSSPAHERGIRKANSAESLRRQAASQGKGLGIADVDLSRKSSGEGSLLPNTAGQAGQSGIKEVKSLWKSFSLRPNRARGDRGHQTKSAESSRHSLAISPEEAYHPRTSTSSTASLQSVVSTSERRNAHGILRSQSSPVKAYMGMASTSKLSIPPTPTEDDGDSVTWLPNDFTHDLKNRKRMRTAKPSMANLAASSRNDAPGTSGGEKYWELDSESEASDAEDATSLLSLSDLPTNFSETGSTDSLRRGDTLKLSKLGPSGMAAAMEQKRKNTGVHVPARIDTSPNTLAKTSPLPLPSRSAPLIRQVSTSEFGLKSSLMTASEIPTARPSLYHTTSYTSTSITSPASPEVTSPASAKTTRPRSYSESFAKLAEGDGQNVTRNLSSGSKPEGQARGRTRSGTQTLLKELAAPRKSLADFVIAVVGPKKVGKSTIVECNLKQSPDRAVTLYEDQTGNRVVSYVGSFSVCGASRTIEILEVDMGILKNTAEGLVWPKYLPKLDGAMICYKQGNPGALEDLKMLLNGFWTRGGVALIALATHCKPGSKKGDGDKAADICNIHGAGLVHLDGGLEDPDRKAKNSLQWVVRKVMDARGVLDQERRRSPTKATKRLARTSAVPLASPQTALPDTLASPSQRQAADSSAVGVDAVVPPQQPTFGHTDKPEASSVLDKNESSGSVRSVGTHSSAGNNKFSQMDIYLTRDDLVQKFLFAAITGNDDQHLSIFLIIYRRFIRPYDLLTAWYERYRSVESHMKEDPLLSRFAMMQLCRILTHSIEFHPGDFTSHSTFQLLTSVVDEVLATTFVQQYGMELLHLLDSVRRSADPDTIWALPDHVETDVMRPPSPERRPSVAPSMDSSMSVNAASATRDLGSTPSTPNLPTSSSTTHTSSPNPTSGKSAPSFTGRGRSYSDAGTTASSDAPPSIHSAASLSISSSKQTSNATSKREFLVSISNQVTDTPAERVSMCITKRAWDIFSTMQPRDLIRYVMAPRDPSDPGAPPMRSADNPVSKAIAFGNYLSNWVASMVMVQSRPKQRARTFEHLIRVAIGLRELDNFDCLMAVLLGLNSQPIHRLTESEMVPLIPPEVYKKFRSLNRLMATTRSFAAYRLAVMNARPEMIPYLGIHLQDITRIHDGKSDMRNGLVNWTKMRQMAKSSAAVIDCSRLAPQHTEDDQVTSLVFGLPVISLDDDTLYEYSYSYKPRQNGSGRGGRFRKLINEVLQQ